VVRSANVVASEVHDFHGLFGIESGRESSEARRWKEAAAESWDKARATGTRGVASAKLWGSEMRGHAESAKNKIAERKCRRGGDEQPDQFG
jgi:hypothetical protein